MMQPTKTIVLAKLDSPKFLGNEDKFVGIDNTSGGYPWETNLFGAHRFESAEKASNYLTHFPELRTRVHLVEIKDIDFRLVTPDPEYDEYIRLKQKFEKRI